VSIRQFSFNIYIFLVIIAIVISLINQFVAPIFFDGHPDSIGTGLSIILLAIVLLNLLGINTSNFNPFTDKGYHQIV
ncbi:hypothetical protein, partial [Neobacillus vireti]|uniref:hypothetical protein n=1 Tax=Neobacillus vireti TaxID=220686 RepID=UPI002FFD9533